MKSKLLNRRACASASLAAVAGAFSAGLASADTIDLVHELDGDSDGVVSFGMIDFTQNGLLVDITITANTTNLDGGDIHEFYFNLPDAIDIGSLAISGEGGVSNQTIGTFSSLGANPSITGGAGASFDAGVGFGNGGGPPGNGTLTTATFSITATGGLLVSDFFAELSDPNNTPDVYAAVHFQSADIFGNGSETVGGVPEPGSLALLGLGGMALLRRRR